MQLSITCVIVFRCGVKHVLSSAACAKNFSDVKISLSCDVINDQNLSRLTSPHAPLAAMLASIREAASASATSASCVELPCAFSTSARRGAVRGDAVLRLSMEKVRHMQLAYAARTADVDDFSASAV